MNSSTVTTPVLIVGAGFSGIALGAMLKRRGIHDFQIIDREQDFGGTWYSNTYPGAECDIQSHLYSFSFRLNPDWTKTYASQSEIFAYLRKVAEEEGLYPHARFGHSVERAEWQQDEGVWRVETGSLTFEAQQVVFATGHLSDPRVPEVPGLEKFSGKTFHSATWDHDYDLRGKNVAVVGTGASAIQVVPAIADEVGSLKVFQRTAPYVIPRLDTVYTDEQKRMFAKVPDSARDLREFLFWSNEMRFLQRMLVPSYLQEVESIAAGHRERQIDDPQLLQRVTPDYTIGCKRILLSNTWYPALQKENVELVDHAVTAFGEDAVVDAAGGEHEVDCVIFCSGFEAAELPIAAKVRGTDGTWLSDVWTEGSEAYGGMAVNGFPNMFLMNGPHVGLGAGSVIFMIETQAKFIAEAVEHFQREDLRVLEVRAESQQEFIEHVERRSEGTVWTEGNCQSWYLDARSNRLTTIWPDQMNRYYAEFASFTPGDFHCVTTRDLQAQPA
ncbi:NAD(P)/FAD-dependent oxidoreductase [Nesterenkonia sp. MY13]|uniref:NAD(P)/FAD-dependent oxidoreductase n=1 Tax=Nesterenkonia sedimenti TaxID=1463632 RepID=A0A7X8YET7_9MICC|nr:NAD(P)/FAD-dependent oxidoreductase [Nesterenkonia sedimenti]NLS10706.1 NAD(P)/FAD-dependent oxidoreductase [Nesterenkonia sedimenti]